MTVYNLRNYSSICLPLNRKPILGLRLSVNRGNVSQLISRVYNSIGGAYLLEEIPPRLARGNFTRGLCLNAKLREGLSVAKSLESV